MLKAVSFFKRKAGMPVEEFQAYWRGSHPAAVVRLPGLRRYVQFTPSPDQQLELRRFNFRMRRS